MEEFKIYQKGIDNKLDEDFKQKKKYMKVYFHKDYLYYKKQFKWHYLSLKDVKKIQFINGTRQLRQCCGAPIYDTTDMIITTISDNNIYINLSDKEYNSKLIDELKWSIISQNNHLEMC